MFTLYRNQNTVTTKLYEPRHRPVIAIKCPDVEFGVALYAELEKCFAELCPTEWLRPCIYMDIGQHLVHGSSPLIDVYPEDYFDAVFKVEKVEGNNIAAPAENSNVYQGAQSFINYMIGLHNPKNKDKLNFNPPGDIPNLQQAKFTRQKHTKNSSLANLRENARKADATATTKMSAKANIPYYLGIYGGMGPLAGANVASQLYEEVKQKIPDENTRNRNIGLAIYSNPAYSAPNDDRIAMILKFSGRSYIKTLSRGKDFLETPVDNFVITSNTMHTRFGLLQTVSHNKCTNMIEHISDSIATQAMSQPTIVLGRDKTRKDGLYKRQFAENGLTHIELTDDEQKELEDIIELIKENKILEGKDKLLALLPTLSANHDNARTFLLACTELPLVVKFVNDSFAALQEGDHASVKRKVTEDKDVLEQYTLLDTGKMLAEKVVEKKLAPLIQQQGNANRNAI